jgi:hypothetical protein
VRVNLFNVLADVRVDDVFAHLNVLLNFGDLNQDSNEIIEFYITMMSTSLTRVYFICMVYL